MFDLLADTIYTGFTGFLRGVHHRTPREGELAKWQDRSSLHVVPVEFGVVWHLRTKPRNDIALTPEIVGGYFAAVEELDIEPATGKAKKVAMRVVDGARERLWIWFSPNEVMCTINDDLFRVTRIFLFKLHKVKASEANLFPEHTLTVSFAARIPLLYSTTVGTDKASYIVMLGFAYPAFVHF